ncbi:MAG: RNA methyltransferase [Saprospiraceae bacterium]
MGEILKSIKSLKNPLIREIIQLQDKPRARKESGLFVIEGFREISMAIQGGFTIKTILYGAHLATYFEAEKLTLLSHNKPEIIEVSREVHLRIFVRESSEAFLAIAELKDIDIKYFKLIDQDKSRILIAESPEKPGNMGAILRTADGVGASAVIIANPRTDLFNANVIRSSLGCVFTLPIYTGTSSEIIQILKKNKIEIYCAYLDASTNYDQINYPAKTAIVVGSEDKGLSEDWIHQGFQHIIIPMMGKVDSLNVSVSAGILMYEVLRQHSLQISSK